MSPHRRLLMLFLSGAKRNRPLAVVLMPCVCVCVMHQTMARTSRFVFARNGRQSVMTADNDDHHLETQFSPYQHHTGSSLSSVENTSLTMEPLHHKSGSSLSLCSNFHPTSTSSGSVQVSMHEPINASLQHLNATGRAHHFQCPAVCAATLSNPFTTRIIMPHSLGQLPVQASVPSNPTTVPPPANVATWTIMETQAKSFGRAKLKQTSHVSALLAGFALVGMVEMDIDNTNAIPFGLMVFFIVNTTLLVSLHMVALLISTWILPHLVSAPFDEQQISAFDSMKKNPPNDSKDKDWPLKTLTRYINLAWSFSTVLGIFLFITELIAIVWVKFYNFGQPGITGSSGTSMYDGRLLALITTVLLLPVLIALFYLSCNFYFRLVLFRSEMQERAIDELNALADGLPDPHCSRAHLNLGFGADPIWHQHLPPSEP